MINCVPANPCTDNVPVPCNGNVESCFFRPGSNDTTCIVSISFLCLFVCFSSISGLYFANLLCHEMFVLVVKCHVINVRIVPIVCNKVLN